jgi:hypothetical protein
MVITCAELLKKLFSGLKVMEQTRSVDFLHVTFMCDLDLGEATQILRSAHHLIMVPSYFKIISGL